MDDLKNGTSNIHNQSTPDPHKQDQDELAIFLERRISEIEAKLKAAQSDLEGLREEHALMISKVVKERRKF